jgi:hypothetical protein
MIWVAQAIEQVQGMVDEMGWGCRTLLGEIHVMGFLVIGSMMNVVLRILLTYLPVNIDFFGSCTNIITVLFLCSSGCLSSSSLDSVCVGDSLFCTSRPELIPTHAS